MKTKFAKLLIKSFPPFDRASLVLITVASPLRCRALVLSPLPGYQSSIPV